VELITSNLDSIQGADGVLIPNPSTINSGLFEGVHTPESVLKHFRNQLKYVHARKEIILNGDGEGLAKFEEIDISAGLSFPFPSFGIFSLALADLGFHFVDAVFS
jgi:vacuolar protein sorting-associated protein 35